MKKEDLYKNFLIAIFLVFWTWAAINPKYPDTWLIENLLVFLFVPAIIILGRYFKLSNLSYTLITAFMILHVIGSHYSYSEVPFGYDIQSFLGSTRNMYDRLVHFAFGLLLAYPIREMFLRVAKVKGFWGYYLPLDVTLSFSVIYELLEWGSLLFAPEASGSFLGTQGDIWDAHKDMLLAGIGAFISISITALINIKYDKKFWEEIKNSFKINKTDKPLGEVALEKLIKNSRKK